MTATPPKDEWIKCHVDLLMVITNDFLDIVYRFFSLCVCGVGLGFCVREGKVYMMIPNDKPTGIIRFEISNLVYDKKY